MRSSSSGLSCQERAHGYPIRATVIVEDSEHHGDSSRVPYAYDDPNSLTHVAKGLYSSGRGLGNALVAASLRHPTGLRAS